MHSDGLSFGDAVAEAQAKGYAEADPGLDIDGHDAAHKLVVLAMLAFGARVESSRVPTEGIRAIDPMDHRFAERFGFVIKHLAIGRDHPEGARAARAPGARAGKHAAGDGERRPQRHRCSRGARSGRACFSGRAPGDLPNGRERRGRRARRRARPRRSGFAGRPRAPSQMQTRPLTSLDDVRTRYYLRFQVHDRPGRPSARGAVEPRRRGVDRADGAGGRRPIERARGAHRDADARRGGARRTPRARDDRAERRGRGSAEAHPHPGVALGSRKTAERRRVAGTCRRRA